MLALNKNKCLIFLDVDGTILGQNGSLIHDESGNYSLDAPLFFLELLKHDSKPIILSSRTKEQLRELSRLLGGIDFVGDLGASIGIEGGKKILNPFKIPKEENPYWLYKKGFLNRFMDQFAHYLEPHDPWWKRARRTLLLRGCFEFKGRLLLSEVNDYLTSNNFNFLRLVDNGRSNRSSYLHCEEKRIYHLTNINVSKFNGALYYLKRISTKKALSIIFSVGDSASDLEMAIISERFFFSGSEKDLSIALDLLKEQNKDAYENIRFDKIVVCENRQILFTEIINHLKEV